MGMQQNWVARAGAAALFAGVLLGSGAPALAADHLECVSDGLTPAQWEGIYTNFHQDVDMPADAVAVVQQCAMTNHWPQAASPALQQFMLGVALRKHVAAQTSLTAANLAALDAQLAALPLDVARRWLSSQEKTAADDTAFAAMMTAADIAHHADQQPVVMEYIGGALMSRVHAADFAGF